MGSRKITVKQSASESIASVAWFIESRGLVATAEKFTDDVYSYFLKLANPLKSYPVCKDPVRSSLGYKCTPYKKRYTIVFIEADDELMICEFIPSKMIYW